MYVLKGDRVRVISGETGEVIDQWGKVRTFIKLKRDSDGRSAPMFESNVVEIMKSHLESKRGRRWG